MVEVEEAPEKISGLYILRFDTGLFVNNSNDVLRSIEKMRSPWIRPLLDIYYISVPNSNALLRNLRREHSFETFLLNGDVTAIIRDSLLWCKKDKSTRHARLKHLNTATMEEIEVHTKHGRIVTPITTKAELIDEILKKENSL